jgi:predicted PurR-regulated permease PerM
MEDRGTHGTHPTGGPSDVAVILDSVIPERAIRFPVRTVLSVLGIVIAIWALLNVLFITRQVLTWILVALFFAIALNPAVDWLQERGVRRRGYAVALTSLGVAGVIALIGWLVIPPLVGQVNDFAQKVPDYIDDLTEGRGRLGFLETKYHIVERIREAVAEGGASKVFGLSGTAISITKSVLTLVAAVITIIALTYFMLLEGPTWLNRFYSLFAPKTDQRLRGIFGEIGRAVGGYVTGNLFISLIAGVSSGLVLWALDVPFALALGLLVALLDLVPLVGATIAAVVVTTVTFLSTDGITSGLIVLGFFIVYQQLENHLLQPLVYGRTVQLSPLVVLIAVLIGASLAGVLGALGAIPMAGAIQVVFLDWLQHRKGGASKSAKSEPQVSDA